MTIKDCYAALGGNYDEVLGRLMREKMIYKFLGKFLDDKSYELLISSMDQNDQETAFRAAHTIKGVCQNLAFTTLYESAEPLTETLRAGDMDKARLMLPQVTADYERTVQAIQALRADPPEGV